MRILLLGAKGQLGRDLSLALAEGHTVAAHDVDTIDIADESALDRLADSVMPEAVINAAAYTNVEKAEEDVDAAFRVNETGAGIVAAMAARHNAPVVLFSTDYVFGGNKRTPYEPDDPVAPIGVYAQSKEAGERATRAANPRHYILRTAWLYGPGGNHFVEKILQAAQTRPSLKVVNDEVGSPSHTEDLAHATVTLMNTGAFGTYHAVNAGACSRYEFALEILRQAGLSTPVAPCASSEFPTKAERPLYSVLSTAKLEAATGLRMRPWQEALERYFQRRKS